METIEKSGNSFILRLDAGDEFISSVQDFCAQNDIKAAWLQAIGSTKELELAYFNLEKKDYDTSAFTEFMEVMSITGNIALKNGKPFCHAHGVFGRSDFSTIGGHVNRCVVSATMEISIRVLEGEMNREFDEKTNLHLLK